MTAIRPEKDVDIILVHGLFIGPWAWDRVREHLPDEFTVHTPELPFQSLASDAALVRGQVASSVAAGRAILLIGHSYGGMVISEAGHDATHLAYLAALAPEPGQTTADVAAGCVTDLCNAAMIPSDDGQTISIDPEQAPAAWYHLSSSEDAAASIARHRSAQASIFGEAVARPAWLERPSTYIQCTEDRAVDPGYQSSMSRRMVTSASVSGDHSAFVSVPSKVAAVIEMLARSCGASSISHSQGQEKRLTPP